MDKLNREKGGNTIVEQLRQTLTNRDVHEPWTSGVVSLSAPEATFSYQRQDGTSRSSVL